MNEIVLLFTQLHAQQVFIVTEVQAAVLLVMLVNIVQNGERLQVIWIHLHVKMVIIVLEDAKIRNQ